MPRRLLLPQLLAVAVEASQRPVGAEHETVLVRRNGERARATLDCSSGIGTPASLGLGLSIQSVTGRLVVSAVRRSAGGAGASLSCSRARSNSTGFSPHTLRPKRTRRPSAATATLWSPRWPRRSACTPSFHSRRRAVGSKEPKGGITVRPPRCPRRRAAGSRWCFPQRRAVRAGPWPARSQIRIGRRTSPIVQTYPPHRAAARQPTKRRWPRLPLVATLVSAAKRQARVAAS